MKKKTLNPIKFITYRINGMHGNHIPVMVDCRKLSNDESMRIAYDADSLHGIGNVRINRSGSPRKNAVLITKDEHFKYDWEKIKSDYYQKNKI